MRIGNRLVYLLAAPLLGLALAGAQEKTEDPAPPPDDVRALKGGAERSDQVRTYVLGANDQITVSALDADELADKTFRLDMSGYVNLPMIGRVRASGLTVQQLEAELTDRLKKYIQDPQLFVSVTEFRSQPVSVLGAVNRPGVHQLQGRKTLIEILSMAEGLRNDAGYSVRITRQLEWGKIPLPSAADDSTGKFSIAQVSLKSIMEAKNPQENIIIQPHDVISVPRADMIYVTGEVEKSGGFVLTERESMSVLQALSLAGGLGKTAAPQNGRILRASNPSSERNEIIVDVRKILAGKAPDMPLQPEDILFVPGNASKKLAIRAIEAAVQTGTGIVIWRGAR